MGVVLRQGFSPNSKNLVHLDKLYKVCYNAISPVHDWFFHPFNHRVWDYPYQVYSSGFPQRIGKDSTLKELSFTKFDGRSLNPLYPLF